MKGQRSEISLGVDTLFFHIDSGPELVDAAASVYIVLHNNMEARPLQPRWIDIKCEEAEDFEILECRIGLLLCGLPPWVLPSVGYWRQFLSMWGKSESKAPIWMPRMDCAIQLRNRTNHRRRFVGVLMTERL